ncbi:MAG TPA: phytase [Candidatus Binatia bacterium]|nr:phytase [Candidatus Binatia bacterium]
MNDDSPANDESATGETNATGIGRRTVLKGAIATAPLLFLGSSLLQPRAARAAVSTGPSTTTAPYLVPSVDGVETVSILTVGDAADGYRMVGIPDGLGAFQSKRGEFTLLMNHEITAGAPGIVRAHGSNGAFVSRWTIDAKTLEVIDGRDQTLSPDHVHRWDPAQKTYSQGTTRWERFCSGDLPSQKALGSQSHGTRERIYLNGEEVTEGRAWAHVVTGDHAGESWELPRLGRLAFENVVASPHPQRKTVVVCLDDSSINTFPTTTPNATDFPSEVYVYIGTKVRGGHPVESAGLTNGKLYGLKVSLDDGTTIAGERNDFGLGSTAFVGSGRFSLVELGPGGDVSGFTNAAQFEQESIDKQVCRFQRVEDGAWDPKQEDDFYFVTTASLTANCRLWRLRFDNVEKPERGGTITILLRGDEGHGMLDNVTIDRRGRILMDEDPGNSSRLAKIWMYHIASGTLTQIASHNPQIFDASIPDNPVFVTQDEESSGIVDAEEILGKGWFLLDVQVHKANPDPELIEGGQLLALFVDPTLT